MSLSLLVIDDDESIRETLVEFFQTFGHVVRGAATAAEGRRMALEHAPDVVLLDLRLPDADGVLTLEALRADDPELGVILLTGHADVRTRVQVMQKGAADVLEKPVDLATLSAIVERVAERVRLRQEVAILRASGRGSVSRIPLLSGRTADELIGVAARSADVPVLLQGEAGTGKSLVARLIHDRSERNQQPFLEVGCGSLSSLVIVSRLFGHERGALEDAPQASRGLFEVAGRGSVFLDDIAELSHDVQLRLLEVVEHRSFCRLGGATALHTQARVLVATRRPLADAVAEGRFRADLFDGLRVLTLTLPPLRAHPEAISGMAEQLLPRGARLGEAARDALCVYAWPGNIRELENTLWRAAILADGAAIEPAHLALPTHAIKGSEHLIGSRGQST